MKMVIFYLYLIVKILNILLIEKIKKKNFILMEIYLALLSNIIGRRAMFNLIKQKVKVIQLLDPFFLVLLLQKI